MPPRAEWCCEAQMRRVRQGPRVVAVCSRCGYSVSLPGVSGAGTGGGIVAERWLRAKIEEKRAAREGASA